MELLLLLRVVVLLLLLLHLDGLLHDLHRAAPTGLRIVAAVRVRDHRVHQLLVVPPQFGLLLMLRLLLELGGLDLSVNILGEI